MNTKLWKGIFVALILVLPFWVWVGSQAFGATYYLRADGTAANKEAASGPCGTQANCMTIAVRDGEGDVYSGDDIFEYCDGGGIFRDQLDLQSSGTSGHPITHIAASGDTPIISGADLHTPGTSWTADTITGDKKSIDHEAGDLSEYDSTTGSPTASTDAEKNGTYGLRAVIVNGSEVYATEALAGAETHLYVSGWFRFSGVSATGTDYAWLMNFERTATGGDNFQVRFVTDGSTHSLEVRARDDASAWQTTGSEAINANIWHWVEAEWKQDTDGGADGGGDDGLIRLWIDGGTVNEYLTIDNDTAARGEVDVLEAIGGFTTEASLSVTLDFDDVQISSARMPRPVEPNRWYATETTGPNIVLFDGTVGTLESNLVDLTAVTEWHWVGNVLYVYSSSDPDSAYTSPGVEAGARSYGIYNEDTADYITIDGLIVEGTNGSQYVGAGIYSKLNNNWTVKNCTVRKNFARGIFVRGNNAGAGSATGWIIEDNTIGSVDCGYPVTGYYAGIYLTGADGAIIRRNTVQANYGKGISTNSGNRSGGGAVSQNLEIYENDMSASEGGVIIWFSDGTKIHHNEIHDGFGTGISVQDTDSSEIHHNLIHNMDHDDDDSGSASGYNGIDLNHDSDSNKIYNNTVYKVWFACMTLEDVDAPSDSNEVKNNIFDASDNFDNDSARTTAIFMNDDCANSVFSNNVYQSGGDATHSIAYLDVATQYTKAEWDAWVAGHSTADTNSIEADPLFTNAGGDDFTLTPQSPGRNAGDRTLTNYATKLHWSSVWPSAVVLIDDILSIGAYAVPRGAAGM